jgi:pimeloyl-ACP methyl ester carboxylesterase
MAIRQMLPGALLVLLLGSVTRAGAQQPVSFAALPGRADALTVERIVGNSRSIPGLVVSGAGDIVIFIPGILGSGLKAADGTAIWGPGARRAVSSLALSLDSPPRAEAFILDAYYVDVYGQMRDALRQRVVMSEADILEFPYDWRHDIERIADWLDEKMRGEWRPKLNRRRVTIIAHSMGGLVAWTWKNKWARQPGRYDFEVSNLVVLGSPLEGSCEMLRMLLNGYRAEHEGALKEKIGYKLLFDNLRAAAYTFPSVFQLLPAAQPPGAADQQTSCLVANDPYPQAVSHLNLSVWDTHLLPILDVGWVRRTVLWSKPVWHDLGLSRDKFLSHLSRMLYLGNKFRNELDLSEEPLGARGRQDSRVTYFYSEEHETTFQVTVGGGWVVSERVLRQGDGRVPRQSATNPKHRGTTPLHVRDSHGALIGGRDFLAWLRDRLADSLKAQATEEILEALWATPAGREYLDSEPGRIPGLIALSDFGLEPLGGASDGLKKTLIEVNKGVLKRVGAAMTDAALGQFAYQAAEHLRTQNRNPKDAVPYYELALASGISNELVPYALAAYSEVLVESKAYVRAVAALEKSRLTLGARPEVAAVAYNNLGRAYECLDDYSNAAKAYAVAAAAGSSDARRNIDTLRLKRDTCR